jgi:hypothetical protein
MLAYLISLPTALVLGIVGNLMTPVVRNLIAARSAARRSKRIAQIRKDIAFVERLRAQPSATTAYVGRKLAGAVVVVVLAGSLNAAALVLLGQHPAAKRSNYSRSHCWSPEPTGRRTRHRRVAEGVPPCLLSQVVRQRNNGATTKARCRTSIRFGIRLKRRVINLYLWE